ncbi:MAG: hypothetical protein M1434_13365 [Chloroflexi bacterium]|nr:hypothetical protein [Chloroflexota bacterium]MCL5275711.1 hypothetical protein [Chloroflexota bacterium]
MSEKLTPQHTLPASQAKLVGSSTSHLRAEYERWRRLFEAQPTLVQRFLEGQARSLADALIQRQPQIRFMLPESVVLEATPQQNGPIGRIPPDFREQLAGGLIDRLTRGDIGMALRQRLAELEQSSNRSVSVATGLVRHATAVQMVHNMLPAGRSVTYVPDEGEEIPTLPVAEELEAGSAITASTDAIAEEGQGEAGRGELLVPYVPAARRFYLPQWVAFDDENHLLVNSTNDAESHIASMQRFLSLLHAAVSLAPYIVADDEYQTKRYGMLGQLINQGRALAHYETSEIISTIKQRAAANDLNRGLSLSLPYFDDQTLKMKIHNFEVIPAGRIMFVPAFVVRAAEQEQAKVAQDTRLSASTRKHLLIELRELEDAFDDRDM